MYLEHLYNKVLVIQNICFEGEEHCYFELNVMQFAGANVSAALRQITAVIIRTILQALDSSTN